MSLIMARLYSGVFSVALLMNTAHAAVSISTNPTKNMNCSAGVCSPTKARATLNIVDVENMLASGNLMVRSDQEAIDIEIVAPLSWANTNMLTLDSYHSVFFRQPVSATGGGGLTIATNEGGSGGDFKFGRNGYAEFWDVSSKLYINGQSYNLVKSIAHLASAVAAHPSGFLALARSYDAASDGTYDSAPIKTGFGGTFSGLGNSLSNVSISDLSQSERVGLFAELDAGGTIRDLRLVQVAVATSPYSLVGGIVGDSSGAIENSSASGSISGADSSALGGIVGAMESGSKLTADRSSVSVTAADTGSGYVGGLVGYSYGSITDSHATGITHGDYGTDVGGLVGDSMTGGSVTNSFAKGDVVSTSAKTNSGGLVGVSGGGVENCSASGKVLSSSQGGGLVGVNLGSIDKSYATGKVGGDHLVDGANGGLVGENIGPVSQSYATGDVHGTGNASLGGLVGVNNGVLTDVYSKGAVSGHRYNGLGGMVGTNFSQIQRAYSIGLVSSGAKKAVLGGFIGYDNAGGGNLSLSYWDLDTSGITDQSKGAGNKENDPGITGLHDSQLTSGLPAGFDPQVWGQNPGINAGYPFLLANPPPQGKT